MRRSLPCLILFVNGNSSLRLEIPYNLCRREKLFWFDIPKKPKKRMGLAILDVRRWSWVKIGVDMGVRRECIG